MELLIYQCVVELIFLHAILQIYSLGYEGQNWRTEGWTSHHQFCNPQSRQTAVCEPSPILYRVQDAWHWLSLTEKIFAKVWENPLAALCFLRKIKLTQMSNCLKLFSRSRIQEIQYWHSKVWKANEKKQIWKPINIDYQPIPHLLSGSQQRLSGYLIAGSYKCLD